MSDSLLSLSKFELIRRLDAAYERINLTYTERNKVVALAAELALACGLEAGLGRDWLAEEGWQHVIYIDLPHGQVSWHLPDEELFFTRRLPLYRKPYDGHHQEEKYERVLNPGLRISHDETEKIESVSE